jgi:hypothetical protein
MITFVVDEGHSQNEGLDSPIPSSSQAPYFENTPDLGQNDDFKISKFKFSPIYNSFQFMLVKLLT